LSTIVICVLLDRNGAVDTMSQR